MFLKELEQGLSYMPGKVTTAQGGVRALGMPGGYCFLNSPTKCKCLVSSIELFDRT